MPLDTFLLCVYEVPVVVPLERASEMLKAVFVPYDNCILANGESVCFLEFGSGVTANGKAIEGYTFTPGSWSSTLGSGQFSELGYWYWNDTKYRYIPAANAMESAIAVMKDRTKEVVERVMKGANA